jgi:soluble lytic murein transglycosylase-like protein
MNLPMTRRLVAAAACLALLLTHAQSALAGGEERRFKKPLKTITRDAGFPVVPAFSKSPYSAIITKYAKSYGVPVDLAHAVVRVESNFNPKARGSAGEVGLMQIKPATRAGHGLSGQDQGALRS